MPIGSTNVYNPGDLILSTVSGSGTSFIETKIIAATSSFILFNSSGTLTSASLNSIVATTSSYVSGSTSIITNLTASNISASGTGSFGIVGIGTTSPAYLLDVSGSSRFGFTSTNTHQFTGSVNISGSLNATASWAQNVVSASYLVPTNSYTITNLTSSNISASATGSFGIVGIGTSNPAYKLDLNVTSNSDAFSIKNSGQSRFILNGDAIMYWGASAGNGLLSWDTGVAKVGGQSGNVLTLFSNGTEKARIDLNGNLGIGTTTVSRKLHTYVTTGPAMRLETSGSNASIEFIPSTGHNRYNWLIGAQQNISDAFEITPSTATNGTTFSTPSLLVKSDGNVGIGTTAPTARLHVTGSTGGVFEVDTLGGATTFYVSASGNVGIGTSSPSNRLDTAVTVASSNYLGDANVYPLAIKNYDTTAGNAVGMTFGHGGYSYTNFVASVRTGTGGDPKGDLVFGGRPTDGSTFTENMRLQAGGNVGIGTTNPTQKLEVQGNGQFGNDSVTNIGLKITRLNGGMRTSEHTYHSSQNSPWYTYGQNLTWTNELAGTVESTQAYRPYFEGFSPAGGYKIFGFMNVSSGAFTSANIVNALTLTNTGDVGIGTTSPANKLSVISGSTRIASTALAGALYLGNDTSNIYLQRDNNYDLSLVQNGDSNSALYLASAGSVYVNIDSNNNDTDKAFIVQNNALKAGTELFRVSETGNVGIGTSIPSQKLHIKSTDTFAAIKFTNSVSDAGIISYSSDNLYFYTANAQRITIDTAGNVGIGTTSPAYLLDVSGSSRHGYRAADTHQFTGSVSVSGSLNATASWANNVVSASYALSSSFTTTAQTANALNALNTYSIAGLTSAYVDVNGSATIPSTGIYRPSSKTLGLSADSTLILKINGSVSPYVTSIETGNFVVQSGSVGIGTTSPGSKLQINDNTPVLTIRTNDGGTSRKAYIDFYTTFFNYPADVGARRTSTIVTGFDSGTWGTEFLAFNVGSGSTNDAALLPIERVRIDGSGNLGIGTTNPTARLHVSGSTIITGSLNVSANITCLSLTETSTEAVKYNILPLPSQLDNVLKLKPVSFNYKANDKHSIGLIAEEVAKIYPEFTSDNNDSISYGKITSVLIQSIKELKTIIDNQQKQIENLIDKLK